MDKLRFMLREFRGRVLVSGRFLAGTAVFFFINFMCFREMPEGLQRMGYTVNLFEMVGAYMSSMVPLVFFYGALAFQVCAFPEWEGSRNTVLRLGKRCWFFEQVLHCALVFLVQYLVLVLSVVAALLPCLVYDNKWSDFMQAGCREIVVVIQTGLNNTIDFDPTLLSSGSPLFVLAVSFLLNLLCTVLLGSVVVLLNTSRSRGTGTVFVLMVIAGRFMTDYLSSAAAERFGTGSLLAKAVDTVCYSLMPMAQNSLLGLRRARYGITGAFPYPVKLAWAAGYFVILTAAVWLWGMRKIKKVDLA